MADDLGFQPVAQSTDQGDIGFQPLVPKAPDPKPVLDIVSQNMANQAAPSEGAQPPTDAQKLDTALGFQVSTALANGTSSLPANLRAPLIQSYKDGTAVNAGDYMQSVLPQAANSVSIGGLNSVLQRTGRDVLSGTGMVVGAIPDSIARLMYTGAQTAGIVSKDISVDDMPSVGGAFQKLGELIFPGGSPQNEIQKKVDQAAQMTMALPLGGAASLPVTAWRTLYLGAAGIFGSEAQDKATKWARDTFPNQPFIQESISQAANWGTMLGFGAGGHAVEPYLNPGHEALKPLVGDAIGKPVDQVTPQDVDQQIAKGFSEAAPKAQDFHDVATVMSQTMEGEKPMAANMVGTLHQIYVDTGVHPDQVFEDAKENPNIAADIAAGKVPDAYENLRSKEEDNMEPTQGPLTHEPALNDPRAFEDQLHQLSTNVTADKIDVLKRAEAAPELPADTWEKLYHHEENPAGVPLTPEEQAVYDEHVKPIAEESSNLFSRLESLGYPEAKDEERPTAENYTPRYVKGRTRSYGEVLEQAKEGKDSTFGGAAGRSMRKTVDAQKSRRFYDAVNPETGEKTLVYIDRDGNALKFDTPDNPSKFGNFERGQPVAPGSEITVDGKPQKLENTTTKKIEDQTSVRYTKNVLANRLDQLSKLRAAVRNAEFIEAMKNSPDFKSVAVPYSDVAIPPETDGRTWRTPRLLQFRNYYMEPELADALDDFARDMPQEGIATTLNKIGRVMNAVMFLNPKAHIDNVFNHMMVERGLLGNLFNAGSTVKSLIKATRDVYNVSPDYVESLRTGASLPYAKILGADVHDKLIEKLGFDTESNPKMWDKIAQIAGYNDASAMVRRLASVPQRVLWFASDAMTLSRIQELEEKDGSLEKAIKETEDHMPNYRVPGQVLGSRNLADLFANPAFGRFGRYEYNRLSSYFKMLNEAFGSDKTIGQRAQSFDRMAMIGAYLYLFYPMMDKAWQAITGNKNASTTRAGAITIPQTALDVAHGNKSIHDALTTAFVPGVPIEMASEAASGNYDWNGQPIIREADIMHNPKQAGIDALNYAGSKLSAIGQAGSVAQGKMTPSQFGYSLLGVKTPTDQQMQERQYYQHKTEREAAKRAARLQQQRNQ